jgi:hypothetical protein
MPDPSQQQPEFKFIPEYADLIAHVATSWASLEYYIADSIWTVAELKPAIGACITAQIFGIGGKFAALLALLKLRQAPETLITKVNKFTETIRGPQERRNRIIHDVWLADLESPSSMGRLELTAPKKLSFKAETVKLEELQADYDQIAKARNEFFHIRADIYRVIPTLPEIPQSELHPIMNVR